ncbi:hypothetical protein G3I40_41780, partial [Streptomyces sp. SID14478]|nr:hypothetical protein [Streptomyces sp. SID14478]
GRMHHAALTGTAPGAVVAAGAEGSDELPLLADRPRVDGHETAYVCRHFVCDAPVTDVDRLGAILGAARD